MVFSILIALCLATSTLAQSCCTPIQWEGTEVVLKDSSQQEVEKSTSLIAYDAENNRTSVIKNVTSMFGKERRLQIISDYVAMKMYEIFVDEEICSKQDLHGCFKPSCIEENDVLLSTGVLGIGANTLSVSTYLQQDFLGHSQMTVTEDCVPVSQIRFSNFENNVEYRLFTNITAGIADINIFTPPAYCNEESLLKSLLIDIVGK